MIFEQLYDRGVREFCFIVGRGKETIYDHFTTDWNFLKNLKENDKSGLADEMVIFYN